MEFSITEMFFIKLSDRMKKENQLSDITWALCESCYEFKSLFLSFFFNEIVDHSEIVLVREFPIEDTRPDFYFYLGEKRYIIEVKIYDRNDHIDHYKNISKDKRFGWIANYQIGKHDGIEIRTWEEFKIYLDNKIKINNFEKDILNILKGYKEYLINVCSIIKLEKMKLNDLTSLFHFNSLTDRILAKPIDNFNCSVYRKSFDNDKSGRSFTFAKINSSEKPIYPWFGIYYDANEIGIYIEFTKEWCTCVYDGIKRDSPNEGTYYDKPFEEEGSYWFKFKDSLFKKFNETQSSDEQELMLTDYFKEVIQAITKYF